MLKISDISKYIESFAASALMESYDNVGLLIGNPNDLVTKALLCIDVTEAIIDEAVRKGANLVISHHPLIFGGIKKLTSANYVERTIVKAIKNNIAVYAAHTNIDSAENGVSFKMAEKLGLTNCQVLETKKGMLQKIVTFVPADYVDAVKKALFEAGAGQIGNYDSCSYITAGFGTFRGNENTNPFVGEIGKLHQEPEIKIETVFPSFLQNKIKQAIYKAHPYEEPAFDIINLDNEYKLAGLGVIGNLTEPTDERSFLETLKKVFHCKGIRHSELLGKPIKTVALCGGSGSSLLNAAISRNADIYISGDFTYHKFFDADKQILIADIGHFESEQFTVEIFYDLLSKKFPNFAFLFSEINTNPINYL